MRGDGRVAQERERIAIRSSGQPLLCIGFGIERTAPPVAAVHMYRANQR